MCVWGGGGGSVVGRIKNDILLYMQCSVYATDLSNNWFRQWVCQHLTPPEQNAINRSTRSQRNEVLSAWRRSLHLPLNRYIYIEVSDLRDYDRCKKMAPVLLTYLITSPLLGPKQR